MSNIKLFEYEHKQIRTIFAHGEIWFIAKDVTDALGITWFGRDTLAAVKPEWIMSQEFPDSLGRPQNTVFINESAVYKLAFRSRKPEAERFTDWIAGEVIPQIRKTGKYVPNPQGVLPLSQHTKTEIQKSMSKNVNAHNYSKGGREEIVKYNAQNCLEHTGQYPKKIVEYGKKSGLKSKERTSAKEVLRHLEPESACSMSLADNLVNEGFEPEKVFPVTKDAKKVFKGILELGAIPAELEQKDNK
jgi:prophage antirepressor-like protein